jgi:starch synthase
MMNIVHISAECYPVAKAGGLADVVGALPGYLQKMGHSSSVIMPKYDQKWIREHLLEVVHHSKIVFGDTVLPYHIYKDVNQTLGFDLFFVDIPGVLDRKGIYVDPDSGYGYWDEFERFSSFQIAAVDWLNSWYVRPDVVHCHDHHTSLIPFLMKHAYTYQNMRNIPTVLTIHNGQYHGNYDAGKNFFIPSFDSLQTGLLQWEGRMNQLACGIKCAWKVTTVSNTYLNELSHQANGIEPLIHAEWSKMSGILNGIDTEVWSPMSDDLIH